MANTAYDKTVDDAWSSFAAGETLSDHQRAFLTQCMSENLEHARHVENERIQFCSIFLALAAGALALTSAVDVAPVVGAAVLFVMLASGVIAMLLTARWNKAFGSHMDCAKHCHELLTRDATSIDDPAAYNSFYCFKIPPSRFKFRTVRLYWAFYIIIEAMLFVGFIMMIVGAI